MDDQVDAPLDLQVEDENSTEEDVDSTSFKSTDSTVESVADLKAPRAVNGIIKWSPIDTKLRVAHEKKVENCQKPSMWEYDPKGRVPTELANLDPSTFLTSRHGRILCFLQKDILVRICSMLSACDFLQLSQTCRFLHWRMFTFCTCYASYTVKMGVEDLHIDEDFWEYTEATLPFYRKKYYDMCLPYIMAVRSLARNLDLIFENITTHLGSSNYANFLNFSDTNNFFTTVNATYYERGFKVYDDHDERYYYFSKNTDIYINCSYARQMNRVLVDEIYGLDRLDVPVFQNRIGIYSKPSDSAIIATLENFLAGSENLIFHQYSRLERNNDRIPIFEYLFQEFGEFDEFFYALTNGWNFYYCTYFWKKVIVTKTGEQLRIEIKKPEEPNDDLYITCPSVTIGKEEIFDEMVNKYIRSPNPNGVWWEMETAVDPDNVEEPDDVEESDETVGLDENEKSEEAEEEQKAFNIFCCLDNNSCTVQ